MSELVHIGRAVTAQHRAHLESCATLPRMGWA